ncbi:DUF262 domain-containing protein [Thiococcus pfennigii]|uniref:DUF262 domain-containing protein n=1 Tax=Thiococcus pfennigii TaxID=1057 RepID=UPI0019032D76|nr:DUF262 domain-containing protein [Thiococcus pfennigii]MBK1731195.1 hypothetical protein [Thiococcus pfennigii]
MAGLFETPQVPRLSALLAEVRSGAILIPNFQRPFEWDDDRRLDLLDSVDKEMPIGAILVWRTREHKLACLKTLGAFGLPSEPGPQVPRAYLLDGHQRLATLYAALNWTDDREKLLAAGVRWPVWYDLAAEPGDRPFRFLPLNRQPPPTWLPMYALLEPRRLYEQQKRLLDAGLDDAAQQAELLANRFKDYQIPVVPLVSEDLRLVTDSFVRVNSGGKRMNETHMVRALAYADDCDIEGKIEALRAELEPQGWGALDDQVLLNVLKVRWGLHIYDADPRDLNKKVQDHGCDQVFEELRRAIGWAVLLLTDLGVRGPRALPYAAQLVAIAELGRRLNTDGPDPNQSAIVNRWFWATTYGEYFTGMPGNRIRDAIDALCQAVTEGRHPIPPDLVREVAPIRTFNFRATRSKALALQMTRRITDEPLREHTQRALGEQGVDAVHRLFAGRDATRPENRIVALPEELERVRQELMSSRDLLLFKQSGNPSAVREARSSARTRFLTEYLVPPGAPVAHDVLRGEISDAVDRILATRKTLIDELERDFLGSLGLALGSHETTN